MPRRRVTPARERALRKALSAGYLRRPGGFGGEPVEHVVQQLDHDRPHIIDRLMRDLFLEPGEAFNQYRISGAGLAVLRRRDGLRLKRAASP